MFLTSMEQNSWIMSKHKRGVKLEKMKMETTGTAADAHDDCLREAFDGLDSSLGAADGFVSKEEVKALLKELKQEGIITKEQRKALKKDFKKVAGDDENLDFGEFEELVKSSESWGKLFEL